jgi:hypothetical protein
MLGGRKAHEAARLVGRDELMVLVSPVGWMVVVAMFARRRRRQPTRYVRLGDPPAVRRLP